MLFFCDLDLTFIQTVRHLKPDENYSVLYTSPKGKEIVMTEKQEDVFNSFSKIGTIIPVTARTLSQTLRTNLKFSSYKICEHGCSLYDSNDKLDQFYQSQVLVPLIKDEQTDLLCILNLLHHYAEYTSKIVLRPYMVLGLIAGIEMTAESEELANNLVSVLLQKDTAFIVSQNGRSISVTVKYPSYKHLAVQYLMQNIPEFRDQASMGLGDSLSDVSFLKVCDFAGIPNTGNVQIKYGE